MNPMIIVPWRAGDPDREAAHDYVTKHIASTGIPWFDVDSNHEPFSRAASKNLGAAVLRRDDVLIFNDADMIIPVEQYRVLAQTAWDTGQLVIGYVEYCALDQLTSERFYKGHTEPFVNRYPVSNVAFSLGGIVAIRNDRFIEAGGYDERFQGWGNEDFALAITCGTLFGNPLPRLEGQAIHFFHQHATLYVDDDQLKANAELLQRYNQITNIDGLREVQGLPC
jgi:hypothetical protein